MLNKLTKKRNKKGFTLVELVVVIAILGILMAIAVPRLTGFRKNAALAADQASAASIAKAADLYAASHNLDDTEKGTLVIATLRGTDGLVEDTTPQQTGLGDFYLKYDGTVFRVYYGSTEGTQLYPDYNK